MEPQQRVEAVVIDLYGTLVEVLGDKPESRSAQGNARAGEGNAAPARYPYTGVAAALGILPSAALKVHLTRRFHSSAQFSEFLAKRFDRASLVPPRVLRRAERLTRDMASNAVLYPDSIGMLDAFATAGIRVAVLSNLISGLDSVVQKLDLHRRTSRVFLSCDLGFAKPDVRAFKTVASELDLEPRRLMMVGDNWGSDVLGSLSAGMWACFLDRSGISPLRKIVSDARPFLQLKGSKIRIRKEIREALDLILPVSILDIEAHPERHLTEKHDGALNFRCLSRVSVVDNLSIVPQLIRNVGRAD